MTRDQIGPVVTIDDFGSVLTLAQIGLVIQRSLRFMRKLEQQQRETGIACLPQQIPGLKHRYRKEDVARWLRSGVPERARKAA